MDRLEQTPARTSKQSRRACRRKRCGGNRKPAETPATAATEALPMVEHKHESDDEIDGSTTAAGSESEQDGNPLLGDAAEDQASEASERPTEDAKAEESNRFKIVIQRTTEEESQKNEEAPSTEAAPVASEEDLAEDQIIYGLAKLLRHMARACKAPAIKSSFQSVRLPKVSLSSYASRIHKYFRCTDECFVLCLIYIDRIVKHHPHIQVTDLTCHRLLLIGCAVAAKFHDDEYASNEYFARVGGIDTKELNTLEAEFLDLLDWKLCVKNAEYEWFLQTLRRIP